MSKMCNNVSTECHLQLVSAEIVRFKTANSYSNAWLDIAANGFWGGKFEHSFEFSTLVHHPIIYLSLLIAAMRGRRDVGMSNVYVRLSMDVLLYSFFTTTGEMDDTASNIQEIG